MQAPIAPRLPLPFDVAVPLLRPSYAVRPGRLPVFPPSWSVVPSVRALVLRNEDGRTLTIDTDHSTVDIRRVALMTLGSHRLSVYSDASGCEARWAGYRLAAHLSLAGFMNLLLSLLWD
jgi:hypothetical protein